MKVNLPVTQAEKPFPKGKLIVSKTDLKGAVTYANDAFVELSGFSREELIGKNHNIVRHPDMPPQAFADLWETVKKGQPWRGVVKNRCKNGDHYWVDAFVVPVRKHNQITGYMSVRTEPAREQINAAEMLYKQLNQTRAPIPRSGFWKNLSIRARLAMIMAFMAAMMLGGGGIGLFGIVMSNKALETTYRDRLEPSNMVNRIMLLMNENRSQIMLALQHNPENASAKMHDHPVGLHTDTMVKNRDEITAVWQDYTKRDLTPEERALADKYAAARGQYVTEGLAAAREAILAGNFNQANEILHKKINPLYTAANTEAEELLKQTLATAKAEYEQALARYETIRNLAVGGTIIGLLLAAIAAMLLVRAIIHPLRQANEIFDRIAQGDLRNEIDISGHNEIGQLQCAMAAMQVHLKVMLDEITVASTEIERRCDHLNTQMSEVVEHSDHQHDRVQEVAAAMEEVSQSVTEVAESAGETSRAAVASQSIVANSAGQMAKSLDATRRVVTAVQASSGTIAELSQAIQRIGDITLTIKEIADQTNLLALNAAIEAARAGEQGCGFAVVADEVRKLAERTANSTTDITKTVSDIQGATQVVVTTMDQAVREVEEGIGLMKESGASLGQITATSEKVTDMSQHIASAAKQQSAATEEVARNMEQISGLIESNATAAQQAWKATEELAKTAEELRVLVRHFEVVA
ncbi:methyl-accepting chemotaxis protein [Sulfuricella sp.]|uniref:methyl-accepting chemotaxis protein n=1 Tax=Sulfuricella sp. TaxID=2099377 RepID=UPI002C7E1306|nr:methyl-accepting chemotaxis protein [Sulfuricella sp.]HUX63248.1 methyl-accepting chemotaxis protein [Sulfuricella sp.]